MCDLCVDPCDRLGPEVRKVDYLIWVARKPLLYTELTVCYSVHEKRNAENIADSAEHAERSQPSIADLGTHLLKPESLRWHRAEISAVHPPIARSVAGHCQPAGSAG
jgi:hypothetical protein